MFIKSELVIVIIMKRFKLFPKFESNPSDFLGIMHLFENDQFLRKYLKLSLTMAITD